MKLLRKIFFLFPDATQGEQVRHYKVVGSNIWKTITGLVEQVAYDRLTKNPQIVEHEEEHQQAPQESQPKRPSWDANHLQAT